MHEDRENVKNKLARNILACVCVCIHILLASLLFIPHGVWLPTLRNRAGMC